MLQFGTIGNPLEKINPSGGYGGIIKAGSSGGPINLLNNVLRLMIVIGGIWALLNIIIAGYGFLSAADDPKKIVAAWNKIWQSALGLLIMVISFVIAAILGYLLFKDPRAILAPNIYGPGQP